MFFIYPGLTPGATLCRRYAAQFGCAFRRAAYFPTQNCSLKLNCITRSLFGSVLVMRPS